MLSSSRRIAVLLAATLLAGPAPIAAWADPRPVSAKDQKMASDLVKKAIAKSEAGDHMGAIKLYNEAYTLAPNSLLLSNIGAQYQELSQWEDALEYFCRYLKEDPSGTNAPYARSQARIVQRQLGRKKVDKSDPCAPSPADRNTTDDSTPKSKGPSDDEVDSTPKRKGPPKDPPSDDEVDSTPKRKAPKDPPSDDPTAPPRPASGNSMLMYTGLAAGIAGLAAGGVGIYYGVQGKNLSDQISSHPMNQQWPDNIRDLQNQGEHYNKLQVGYLIASGVLVTSGVVLYVVSRPDAAPEHASDKTVHVAPTANGVTVFGRF